MNLDVNTNNYDVKKSSLYKTVYSTFMEILKDRTEDMVDDLMPSLMKVAEPFIEERLNQYQLYVKMREGQERPIILYDKEDIVNEVCDWMKTNLPDVIEYNGKKEFISRIIIDLKEHMLK